MVCVSIRIVLESLPYNAQLLHRLISDIASGVEDRDGDIECQHDIVK